MRMLESEFKAKIIKDWKSKKVYDCIHCIESEETCPGFPDVLARDPETDKFTFYEFKVTDAKGYFKFTKDQPRFYRLNPKMDIRLIVLDNRNDAFFVTDIKKVQPFIATKLRVNIDEVFDSQC